MTLFPYFWGTFILGGAFWGGTIAGLPGIFLGAGLTLFFGPMIYFTAFAIIGIAAYVAHFIVTGGNDINASNTHIEPGYSGSYQKIWNVIPNNKIFPQLDYSEQEPGFFSGLFNRIFTTTKKAKVSYLENSTNDAETSLFDSTKNLP